MSMPQPSTWSSNPGPALPVLRVTETRGQGVTAVRHLARVLDPLTAGAAVDRREDRGTRTHTSVQGPGAGGRVGPAQVLLSAGLGPKEKSPGGPGLQETDRAEAGQAERDGVALVSLPRRV